MHDYKTLIEQLRATTAEERRVAFKALRILLLNHPELQDAVHANMRAAGFYVYEWPSLTGDFIFAHEQDGHRKYISVGELHVVPEAPATIRQTRWERFKMLVKRHWFKQQNKEQK